MKPTLRILLCLTLLPLLLGCTGHRRYAALLDEAEQANRVGRSLPSENQMLEVARHYDRPFHSANNRMRAYYLLGCVYRDRGEAPAALHYYNTATERADTLSKDCDYATLFRVYGQMAEIYERQCLPYYQLLSLSAMSHYALLANDTVSSVIALDHMADAYYALDDTVNSLKTTEMSHRRFLEMGMKEHAARVYPTAIYISLKNGNLGRARRYMETYERESGYFDKYGNIQKGCEAYYNNLGLYYCGTGQLDSAEHYFRLLRSYGYELEACEGLLQVFECKEMSDSILKYAPLYKDAQIQWATKQQADAIIQSSSLYDYSCNQHIAEKKTQEAKSARYLNLLLATLLLVVILITWMIYRNIRQRHKEQELKYRDLDRWYSATVREYNHLRHEYSILQSSLKSISIPNEAQTQELLNVRQKRIEELEIKIKEYQSLVSTLDYSRREQLARQNAATMYFKEKTRPQPTWTAPEEDWWMDLIDIYKRYMPVAYTKISLAHLSHQETFICILLHLGFTTGEIALLLTTTPQRITNAKKSANKKLFNNDDAPHLLQNLVNAERNASEN